MYLWGERDSNPQSSKGADLQSARLPVTGYLPVLNNLTTLWDLNPCNPRSSIYEEYIDKYRTQGLAGGYQYQHFTIKDNATITPERIAEIESRYDPNTVWYRRDILGERAVAEGLIYQLFADKPERFCVDGISGQIQHAVIGVDFGGGTSAHAFCCVGYSNRSIVVLDEYREAEALNPTKLEQDFVDPRALARARAADYADAEPGKPLTYTSLGFSDHGKIDDYASLHAFAEGLGLEKTIYDNGGIPVPKGRTLRYFYHLNDLEQIILTGRDLYHGKALD